jgi:hypothetical protein
LKFLFRKVYLDLNEPGENRRKPTWFAQISLLLTASME